MNLPRHSITSHAITPIFVNAHFTSIEKIDEDHQKGFKNKFTKSSQKSNSNKTSFETSKSVKSKNEGEDDSGSGSSSNNASGGKGVGCDNNNDDNGRLTNEENYFACATNQGFFVARIDPFKLIISRQFPILQGGLAHVALIDDSSLMILVGGGRVPRFAPNKVILWDENLTFKVPISSNYNPINLEGDDALSEGTASPPPSTIFSLGREQDETEKNGEEILDLLDDEDTDEGVKDEHELSKDALQQSEPMLAQTMGESISSNSMDKSETNQRNSTEIVGEIQKDLTSSTITNDKEKEEKVNDTKEKEEDEEDISASISIARSVSGSLMASTANMADPFETSSSPTEETKDNNVEEDHLESSMRSKTEVEENTSHSMEASEEKEQQFRIERGREVAELEFGEAVQSIKVESFTLNCCNEEDEEDLDSPVKQTKVAILIVTLQTKAIIFELGTHLPKGTQVKNDEKERFSNSSWNIRQRLILDIHPDSSSCLPAISQIEETNCALIALPGRQNGHVQLISVEFSHTGRTPSIAGASTIIAAHTNSIACLQLSKDGHYLCTASERGTLLRLWSTFSGLGLKDNFRSSSNRARRNGNDRITTMAASLLGELRRGSESAKILSVAFTPDKRFLAVASDKGTIHFFDLAALLGSLPFTSTSSSATMTAGIPKSDRFGSDITSHHHRQTSQTGIKFSQQANRFLPNAIQNFAQQIPTSLLPQYFKSQWSFAQFKINLKIFSGRMNESMRYVKAPEKTTIQKKSIKEKNRFIDKKEEEDENDEKDFIGDAFVPDRERNLEGGWAKMRGRVSDIRKGERTIQESIWLTWVNSSSSSMQSKENSQPFQLIAITSSGGLYRLAINANSSNNNSQIDDHSHSSSNSSSSSTILDMYRNDSSSSYSDRQNSSNNEDPNQGSCSLIEHIRFGKRDEWID